MYDPCKTSRSSRVSSLRDRKKGFSMFAPRLRALLPRALPTLGICALLAFAGLTAARPASAAPITYTGQLLVSNQPVSGSYDIKLLVYSALTGGSQVGSTVTLTSVPVKDGVFYVEPDFGMNVFNTGATRYLETQYRVHPTSGNPAYTVQSPRKLVPTSAYALYSRNTGGLQGNPISTTAPNTGQVLKWNGSVWQPGNDANTTYSAGSGLALSGTTFSLSSGGITSGDIAANAVTTNKIADGAVTASKLGAGSVGTSALGAGSVTGAKIAVPLSLSGSSSSPILTATNSSTGYGVEGSSSYLGVYGVAGTYGVYGDSNNGGYGVFGYSSYIGAYGDGGSYGVYGYGTSGYGGYFVGAGNDGVQGHTSLSGYSGVYGANDSGGSSGYGGYFVGPTDGVYASTSTGTSGDGVYGNGYNGVYGNSNAVSGNGVYGYVDGSSDPFAIWGYNNNGTSGPGYAGVFDGNVIITGTTTAVVTASRIDHPQDPSGKYLVHASVQSDRLENIYHGHVVTDSKGSATVKMPSWFEALNQDFEYQLTCIGQFAQAIVGQEITANTFVIKTDKPNVRVSWQVTGVRHDAFAQAHPLVVEQTKPDDEQGTYLSPEAFGQPASKSTHAARLARQQALRVPPASRNAPPAPAPKLPAQP